MKKTKVRKKIKQKRSRTYKKYGAGNFIDPENIRECYTHLETDNDVEIEFAKGFIDDTLLFKNIEIEEIIGKGGYNRVYASRGINKCLLESRWSINSHSLLFRISRQPLEPESIATAINNFKNEMKQQVKLSFQGIMPFIYACGYFKCTEDNDMLNTEGGNIYSFTLMERVGQSVQKVLENPEKRGQWETLIKKICKLYEKLAKNKICNIDVYPENVVVSFNSNGDIERIALIDVDMKFNIDIKDWRLSADIMKAIFLLPIRDNENNTTDVEILNIVNNQLNKINPNSFVKIRELLQENKDLRKKFSNYGIIEYFDTTSPIKTQTLRSP